MNGIRQAMIVFTALALGYGLAASAAPQAPGARERKKDMCPGVRLERLAGSDARLTELKEGIEIIVVSTIPAITARLQAEARAYYTAKEAPGCSCCPAALPGASIVVMNLNNGIKVTITGSDPEQVNKIQAAGRTLLEPARTPAAAPARAKKKAALYRCPMDGYESDKPGKCPKCGMDLVKVK